MRGLGSGLLAAGLLLGAACSGERGGPGPVSWPGGELLAQLPRKVSLAVGVAKGADTGALGLAAPLLGLPDHPLPGPLALGLVWHGGGMERVWLWGSGADPRIGPTRGQVSHFNTSSRRRRPRPGEMLKCET